MTSAGDPDSLREFAFQSGQFDAVLIPERLAGRLAPSVFALVGELSRVVFAALFVVVHTA
jgi:hypothetical protein